MNNNKGILIIIAVALIGILTVLVIEANKKTPGEEIADSISNVADDIGGQID